MGLDMYLTERIYVGAEYEHREVTGDVSIYVMGEPLDIPLNKVSEIMLRVAYWRKDNQIHNLFITNHANGVDDCQEIGVIGAELEQLVALCEDVLRDHSKAKDLLPPAQGFFFGTYEYDDWYFQGLEDTVRQLRDVKEDSYYIYQASW